MKPEAMSREEKKQFDAVEALSEIAQKINTIQEIKPLLDEILVLGLDELAAERGFVLLKSGETGEAFEVETSRNLSENQISDITQISSSVIRNVLSSGEAILLFEAEKDPRYRTAESIVIQKIKSIACIPLSIKNRQIGAIYLDSVSKRSRFTQENLPFLTAFANQAAIAIENARLYQALRNENRRLRGEVQRIHGFDEIIGRSREMEEVFDVMSRLLDTDASVLIEGESGTGKELVARAIHYNGHRKDKPFMALFCGALPGSLLESELFGHKKGSFTGAVTDKRGLFEAADGGTFFLDEIGDLNLDIQTKLLRVLQEGEIRRVGDNKVIKVDVRIISATNKTLTDLVQTGEFREDLYYRLNTIPLLLPALRNRSSDVPLLAHHFLDKFAARSRSEITGFERDTVEALMTHDWPGNVRELENTIERAVVMARGKLISRQDLRLPATGTQEDSFAGSLTLQELTRRAVKQALDAEEGNISAAAKILDVSRRWLHYKIKEWEL